MSIPVPLEQLRAHLAQYGMAPYLLTTGADGRPRTVAVQVRWDDDALVAEVGARTATNVEARPLVALLWPPTEAGGYSLIVDGEARCRPGAREVVVRPTSGVLHRPAPAGPPAPSGCGADCVRLI